jgi:hypothetical protein
VAGGGFAITAVAFLINPGLGLLVFLFAVPICDRLLS